MDVYVPAVPKRLTITLPMIEDFLIDPVMGAKVITGYDLDVFQAARLRYYWWVPHGIDSSGYSSGKTIVDWIYIALRCTLISDHHAGVYYPTFQNMKDTFWQYYSSCRAPIWRAQLGRLDEEGEEEGSSKSRGPSCFKAFYRNGSQTWMPAPSFVQDAKAQASLRLNTLLVEEWPQVDAMGQGINKQLSGRVTRPCYNQYHPIWCNHIHLTAPAKDSTHPGYARYKENRREVRRGDPSFFDISYCYKDHSDLPCHNGKTFREEFRIESNLKMRKVHLSENEWLGDVLGVWGESGRTFYTPEMLDAAVQLGKSRNLTVIISRQQDAPGPETFYFAGVDPAPAQGPKSDDGAIIVLRARSRHEISRLGDDDSQRLMLDSPAEWIVDTVYARRVRDVSIRQWSGMIHHLHRRFGFAKIGVDHGGGGQWVKKELGERRQLIDNVETDCTPIVTPEDITVADGYFILTMMACKDASVESIWPDMQDPGVLVDRQHTVMMEALNNQWLALPMPYKEAMSIPAIRQSCIGFGEERMWAWRCLTDLQSQFIGITVLTKEDGTFSLTRHGARQFISKGKKDFVSAILIAWTAFLIWLKNNSGEQVGHDEVMFSGWDSKA